MNRLVRHNLRRESRLLLFAADRRDETEMADIEAVAEGLSHMHETHARRQVLRGG